VIYKHAIKLLKLGAGDGLTMEEEEDLTKFEREKRAELYKSYVNFEKKHGDRQGIEDVILTKQRGEYKKRLEQDPHDYDGWFEWAKLETDHGDTAAVRDVFEQAVSKIPPTEQKDHWRRYIYLWIYYAVFEEINMKDADRASQVYDACLSIIPHKKFSFAKVWIYASKLQIRRKNLAGARKMLGRAIGLCGKEKIYIEYIALELALGEVDRCRKLSEMPYNCKAWSKYAELEKSVGETDRCRAIFELAISRDVLDMPDMLWKGYIDFEIEEGESEKARKLYERLLERTGHVKAWISYAQFEGSEIGKGPTSARSIFQKAYDQLKEEGLKEERVLLLDAWRVYEKAKGDDKSISSVEAMMPRRIKKKRMRTDENGQELGWEEIFDYHFPDDHDAASSNLKILEMAAKWKKLQAQEDDDDDSDMDSDDE
jgi:crooked neck